MILQVCRVDPRLRFDLKEQPDALNKDMLHLDVIIGFVWTDWGRGGGGDSIVSC